MTKKELEKKYGVEKQFYRPKEVAEYLSIGLSTVWSMVKSGRLTSIKLSPKVTVFDKNEIDSLVK